MARSNGSFCIPCIKTKKHEESYAILKAEFRQKGNGAMVGTAYTDHQLQPACAHLRKGAHEH